MKTKLSLVTVSAAVLTILFGIGAASAADTLYADPKVKQPTISVVQNPTAMPAPEKAGKRAPKTHKVSLTTTEAESKLDDGTTYTYWTFNNTVPGPMVRVRVGDLGHPLQLLRCHGMHGAEDGDHRHVDPGVDGAEGVLHLVGGRFQRVRVDDVQR